jgi:hypothetical protein
MCREAIAHIRTDWIRRSRWALLLHVPEMRLLTAGFSVYIFSIHLILSHPVFCCPHIYVLQYFSLLSARLSCILFSHLNFIWNKQLSKLAWRMSVQHFVITWTQALTSWRMRNVQCWTWHCWIKQSNFMTQTRKAEVLSQATCWRTERLGFDSRQKTRCWFTLRCSYWMWRSVQPSAQVILVPLFLRLNRSKRES